MINVVLSISITTRAPDAEVETSASPAPKVQRARQALSEAHQASTAEAQAGQDTRAAEEP